MPRFAVILPAAGSSTRFGGPRSKLFETIAGRSVFALSASAFLDRADVALVIVPVHPRLGIGADVPADAQELLRSDRIRICPGGAHRAQSVRNALALVPPDVEWMAVHDAARPLVSQGLIDRTFAAAIEHGAAVPATAVTSTIKQATGPLPAKVERTLPRHTLWAMQTPQVMRRGLLEESFARCPLPPDQITDDVQLLELCGYPVWLVDGEERNLKITTPSDLRLAELLYPQ